LIPTNHFYFRVFQSHWFFLIAVSLMAWFNPHEAKPAATNTPTPVSCDGTLVTVGDALTASLNAPDNAATTYHFLAVGPASYIMPFGGKVVAWRIKHSTCLVGQANTLTIWRLVSGTTYSCVGTDQQTTSTSAESETFTVSVPINVLSGDIIGMQRVNTVNNYVDGGSQAGASQQIKSDTTPVACINMNLATNNATQRLLNVVLCQYSTTSTATATATATSTSTATATHTFTHTSTATLTDTATASATHTSTATATSTATHTATATSTATRTATSTHTSTATITRTSTRTAYHTRTATATATGHCCTDTPVTSVTPSRTATRTKTRTWTRTRTLTKTRTRTPTP